MDQKGPYGRLVSQERDGAPFYHHFDALGSTRELSDSAQVTSSEYVYGAWGEPKAAPAADPNPYRWVGEIGYRYDSTNAVYNLRAREFKDNIGRFLSRDPIREENDEPNRYRYGDGNPTEVVDPSGEEPPFSFYPWIDDPLLSPFEKNRRYQDELRREALERFNGMSFSELLAYVLTHPDDDEARRILQQRAAIYHVPLPPQDESNKEERSGGVIQQTLKKLLDTFVKALEETDEFRTAKGFIKAFDEDTKKLQEQMGKIKEAFDARDLYGFLKAIDDLLTDPGGVVSDTTNALKGLVKEVIGLLAAFMEPSEMRALAGRIANALGKTAQEVLEDLLTPEGRGKLLYELTKALLIARGLGAVGAKGKPSINPKSAPPPTRPPKKPKVIEKPPVPADAPGSGTHGRLKDAANRAHAKVGQGKGPVHGTKVHKAFEDEIKALGDNSLHTEVSYKDGKVVPRGTKGSVRLDVVEGPPEAPTAVFDLKTGGAKLTEERIKEIQQHVPGGSGVPVIEVR